MTIDANQVVEKVRIGSAPPLGTELFRAGFTCLALCAEEIQPRGAAFPGITVVHAPMDDALLTREIADVAHEAADVLYRLWRREDQILVTCAAGRNRSGLVTALLVRRIYGCSGKSARELVQSRRAGALTNGSFARYLDSLRRADVMMLGSTG